MSHPHVVGQQQEPRERTYSKEDLLHFRARLDHVPDAPNSFPAISAATKPKRPDLIVRAVSSSNKDHQLRFTDEWGRSFDENLQQLILKTVHSSLNSPAEFQLFRNRESELWADESGTLTSIVDVDDLLRTAARNRRRVLKNQQHQVPVGGPLHPSTSTDSQKYGGTDSQNTTTNGGLTASPSAVSSTGIITDNPYAAFSAGSKSAVDMSVDTQHSAPGPGHEHYYPGMPMMMMPGAPAPMMQGYHPYGYPMMYMPPPDELSGSFQGPVHMPMPHYDPNMHAYVMPMMPGMMPPPAGKGMGGYPGGLLQPAPSHQSSARSGKGTNQPQTMYERKNATMSKSGLGRATSTNSKGGLDRAISGKGMWRQGSEASKGKGMSRGKSVGNHNKGGGSWRLGPDYVRKIDEAYKKAISPRHDEGEGTTCMLKNIPNKYSRSMLIERLVTLYPGNVNFIYMPIDFSTECNVGYAFVNFRNKKTADMFQTMFDSRHTKECLPGYNSNKIAQVSLAAVQGLRANMDHLSKSALLPMLNMHEQWQPVLFDREDREIAFPCDTGGPMPQSSAASNRRAQSANVQQREREFQARQAQQALEMEARQHEARQLEAALIAADTAVLAHQGSYTNTSSGPSRTVSGAGAFNLETLPTTLQMPTAMVRTVSQGSGGAVFDYGNVSPGVMDASTMAPPSPMMQSPHGSPSSKPTLADVSHLVQPPVVSPKQKRISDSFRSSVTRNQIEIFFDPAANERKELHEDLDVLRKAADHEGWIPLSTLMSLKNMYYPGHDLMRDAIMDSSKLEFHQKDDMFRCKDDKVRTHWLSIKPLRQPSK